MPITRLHLAVPLLAIALLVPGCAPGAVLGGESCAASAGAGAVVGGTTGFILSRVLGASRNAQIASTGVAAVAAGAIGYGQCRAARRQQRALRAELAALEGELAAERARALQDIEDERRRAERMLGTASDSEQDDIAWFIDQLDEDEAEIEAVARGDRFGRDEPVPGGGIIRSDEVVGVERREGDEVSGRVFSYALDLSPSLTFQSGRADLRPAGRRALRAVAESIQQEGGRSVVAIVGHTDTVGPADRNQALSERRARAVREVLLASGVDARQAPEWATKGRGETELLVDPEITADDRRRNRRVQILILPGG